VAPEAAGAVKAFRACGWDVVVVGGPRDIRFDDLDVGWRRSVDEPDPGAWLLTDEISDDRWARPLGIHTALVGPRSEQLPGPARCDVSYRDLRTAALEILSTDAAPAGQADGATG
jgi:hypothetical protein